MKSLVAVAPRSSRSPAPAQAAAPSRVLVEATEFRFTLSRTTVKAGPAIVQLAIRGEDPHDLRLAPARRARRRRSSRAVPETLPGRASPSGAASSRAGRWTLYCSLPGHKKAGMRATLTVRSACQNKRVHGRRRHQSPSRPTATT